MLNRAAFDMKQIELFEHPRSSYAQKVRILLREKNIPFLSREVKGIGSGKESVDFKRLNPRRQVPVIDVDGDAVFDSTIILEYLEERFPTPALMPEFPLARARARMIEDIFDTQWEAINWGLGELYYFQRGDEELRQALRSAAEDDAAIMYQWLERQWQGGEWLAGERFGWADLCAIPFVATTQRFGVLPEPGTKVDNWLSRALLRPSVKETVAEAHAYHREMPEAVSALKTGDFKREYRDHRLEWMIRAGGLAVVEKGLEENDIRFIGLSAFAPNEA